MGATGGVDIRDEVRMGIRVDGMGKEAARMDGRVDRGMEAVEKEVCLILD